MPDDQKLSNAVFISYRRQASEDLAYAIYQGLRLRQIDPFFDYQSIPAGRWLETILRQIAARPYFLLVLAPGTLERCANLDDILRREIQEAVTLDRMIVPLTTHQFDRADVGKYLPPLLARTINDFQGLDLPSSRTYYEAAFDRLRDRYLSPIPLIVTPPPIADLELLRDHQAKVDTVVSARPASAALHLVKATAVLPPTSTQQRLLDIMLDPRHPPAERAKAGDDLNQFGDPRPGVGLRPDGLPDIEWCEVLGLAFIYQNGEKHTLPTFHIAKYPITYKQFGVFLAAPDGFKNADWWRGLDSDGLTQQQGGPGGQFWKLDNHPRENVSWYDSMAFCRWLSAKLSCEIQLPTELEWEKAAHGTKGREYPWGDGYRIGYANIDDTDKGIYLEQTTAVGIYPQGASPYKVMDMSGNVWEWTQTDYNNPNNRDLSASVPRALRGGSWFNLRNYARASSRFWFGPHFRSWYLGFRVVCSVPVS